MSKIKEIKEYENLFSGERQSSIQGTSSRGLIPTSKGYTACPYNRGIENLHFTHCGEDTIRTMSQQGKERDGYIVSLLCAIGNSLMDLTWYVSANISQMFKKMDAIGDSLEALPSKKEYQNSKQDFAQILGLIKLIAKKQGMNDQTIEELRPPIIASENEQ